MRLVFAGDASLNFSLCWGGVRWLWTGLWRGGSISPDARSWSLSDSGSHNTPKLFQIGKVKVAGQPYGMPVCRGTCHFCRAARRICSGLLMALLQWKSHLRPVVSGNIRGPREFNFLRVRGTPGEGARDRHILNMWQLVIAAVPLTPGVSGRGPLASTKPAPPPASPPSQSCEWPQSLVKNLRRLLLRER